MRTEGTISEDQRALLALLLRHQESYGQIASALGIQESALRERALLALSALAPEQAALCSAAQLEQVADLLLGRLTASERLIAYERLRDSVPGSALLERLREQLDALAGGGAAGSERRPPRPREAQDSPGPPAAAEAGPEETRLPGGSGGSHRAGSPPAPGAPPSEQPAAADAPRAPSGSAVPSDPPASRLRGAESVSGGGERSSAPASRRTGALLLLAFAGLLLGGLYISGALSSSPSASRAGGNEATVRSETATTTGSTAARAREEARFSLRSPGGASSARGEAVIASVSGKSELALEAHNLPSAAGASYVVWLYADEGNFEAVGRASSVTANGTLPGSFIELPADVARFHELVITRESSAHPVKPGEIILSGSYTVR